MSTKQQDNAVMETHVVGTIHTQRVSDLPIGDKPQLLNKWFLSSTGPDVRDLNVDGTTPVNIDVLPSTAGEVWRIYSLQFFLEDNGTFTSGTFGALAALANGLLLSKRDGSSELIDLLEGFPIKQNSDLFAAFDVEAFPAFGSGNDHLVATLNFQKKYGQPLRLTQANSERVRLVIQDNLTTLVRLFLRANGIIETTRV